MTKKRVWAIPLARNGRVIDEITNPVRWHIEDYDTPNVAETLRSSYETKAAAEAAAKSLGYIVMDGEQ